MCGWNALFIQLISLVGGGTQNHVVDLHKRVKGHRVDILHANHARSLGESAARHTHRTGATVLGREHEHGTRVQVLVGERERLGRISRKGPGHRGDDAIATVRRDRRGGARDLGDISALSEQGGAHLEGLHLLGADLSGEGQMGMSERHLFAALRGGLVGHAGVFVFK